MEKAKVFISYSRKDLKFVERLYNNLREEKYDCTFDKAEHDEIHSGVSAEDDWWYRLKVLITACDVMIYVVSVNSSKSRICDEEIAYAKALSKRVIPILLNSVDFSRIPPRLGALNIKISFKGDNENEYNTQLNKLLLAIDTDIIWHRELRRFVELAVRWDSIDRPESLLLRIDQLRIAQDLISRRPTNAEKPAELLFDFLQSSLEFEERIERKRRRLMGAAFVIPAQQALQNHHHDYALRLMAAGCIAANDYDFEIVPELWFSAARAIFESRLISRLYGHTSGVVSVAISENGNIVATGSVDNSIRIWDSRKGCCIDVLYGHSSTVWALEFGPLSGFLFSASSDGLLLEWDLKSKTHRVVWSAEGLTGINKFKIDRSENLLCAVLQNQEAICIRLKENDLSYLRLIGHKGSINDICIASNSELIGTCSVDKTVRLWSTRNGNCIAVFDGHEDEVNSIAFSEDGKIIASCSGGLAITIDRTVRLWNCEQQNGSFGEQFGLLGEHEGRVTTLDFHPNKLIVASGSTDRMLKIWDVSRRTLLYNLSPEIDKISVVRFSPDGSRLLAFGDLGSGILIDVNTGNKICRLDRHDHSVFSVAFSKDGTTVAVSSLDKTVSIWDAYISAKFFVDNKHQGPNIHEFIPTPSFDNLKLRRIVTPRNNFATILSEKVGFELMVIEDKKTGIESAGFVNGINRLFFEPNYIDQESESRDTVWTTGRGKGVSYWDVTKTRCLEFRPILLLTASLANGQGRLTGGEPNSFLLDDVPTDLFTALMDKLSENDQKTVHILAIFLRNRLHTNCYTNFEER
jgi:WD40 repeat protein